MAAFSSPNLARLRRDIQALEQTHGSSAQAVPTGVPDVDRHLPGGGLPPSAVHEIRATGPFDQGATLGFAAQLAAAFMAGNTQTALWCRPRPRGHGLALYGRGLRTQAPELTPDRLILVHTTRETETLWVLEEALRSGALGVVLGELKAPGSLALRRLQLAAETGGVPGLLITPAQVSERSMPTYSRWRVGAEPGGWTVALERYRGAAPKRWHLALSQRGGVPS